MRKLLTSVLAILMACVFLLPSLSFAEIENGEGIVTVVDHSPEEILADALGEDCQPSVPEGMEKTVFEIDDRITVTKTSAFPYCAVAYMVVKGECGCEWFCTGFMVNRDRLLTAAHCLVCTDHSKWAKNITFYFGYKNRRTYVYKYTGGWSAYVGNVFRGKEYTTENDYGCIRFAKNVGDRVGWFGTHWNMSDGDIASTRLYVAGYRDGELKYDSGYVDETEKQYIRYRMDTVPGESGGPIFTGDYYAVGIHISGGTSSNVGYRLIQTVKSDLDGL